MTAEEKIQYSRLTLPLHYRLILFPHTMKCVSQCYRGRIYSLIPFYSKQLLNATLGHTFHILSSLTEGWNTVAEIQDQAAIHNKAAEAFT